MIGVGLPACLLSLSFCFFGDPSEFLTTVRQTTDISATSDFGQLDSLNQSILPDQSDQSKHSSTSDLLDRQSLDQTERDLLYLNILNDPVKESTESSRHYATSSDGLTPRNCLWSKLSHLDDTDNEYLARKGVFDLPPSCHL